MSSKYENSHNIQARAITDTIALYYRAELAEALLSKKPTKSGLLSKDYKERTGKKAPPSVVEVMMRPYAKMTRKQRAKIANKLVTIDLATKKQLSAKDQYTLRKLVQPNSKTPMIERSDLLKDLSELIRPVEKIDIEDHESVRQWVTNLGSNFFPAMAMLDPDGRPDDSEPDPTEDDETSETEPTPEPTPPIIPYTSLQFNIERIRCANPTNGEWGDDEINYGGIAVEGPLSFGSSPSQASGEVLDIFDAGSFRNGTIQNFTPNTLMHSYSLNGVISPHLFVVFFAMAEIDTHAVFETYINDVFTSLEAEIEGLFLLAFATEAAIMGAGIAIGAIIGGPIAILITGVLGIMYGFLSYFWIMGASDDIFDLSNAELLLSQDSLQDWPFFGSNRSVSQNMMIYGDGGRYEVTYHWQLAGFIQAPPNDLD